MKTKFIAFCFRNANAFLKKFKLNKLIFFSENPIDHIIDNLYLGDFRAAEDLTILKKNGITHIINCAAHIPEVFKEEITYLSLEMADDHTQDLTDAIKKADIFIKEATEAGGNVFIHCQQGVSRSASIVLSYLISSKGLSYEEAVELLTSKRKVVKPNKYFAKQLKDYEVGLAHVADNNEKLSNTNIIQHIKESQENNDPNNLEQFYCQANNNNNIKSKFAQPNYNSSNNLTTYNKISTTPEPKSKKSKKEKKEKNEKKSQSSKEINLSFLKLKEPTSQTNSTSNVNQYAQYGQAAPSYNINTNQYQQQNNYQPSKFQQLAQNQQQLLNQQDFVQYPQYQAQNIQMNQAQNCNLQHYPNQPQHFVNQHDFYKQFYPQK